MKKTRALLIAAQAELLRRKAARRGLHDLARRAEAVTVGAQRLADVG